MNPFHRKSVAQTQDFLRIKNLPVRTESDLDELARQMTEALRAPGGTMALRPLQALALYELMQTEGGFYPLGVGTGKTLICLLAPVVLGLKRAIGLLPAALLEKTERERAAYAKHFRVDRTMQFVSYEMLGRTNAANLLEVKRPDGLITDESHRLKNAKAACTRRVARWMKEHPETKFVAMSGTMSKKSLRDFAHLLRWSLGPEHAPVPMTEGELEEWANCLDERVQPLQRVKPGALVHLAPGVKGGDELSLARRCFQERLTKTPGVVCSLNGSQVDCALYIEGRLYDVNEATEANFRKLRDTWETPDGWALSEAAEVWAKARELAIGMHYVWEPRPPEEWLNARRGWAKFVRDTLSRSRTLDSEKQVADACDSGDLPADEYREWMRMKPTFVINQKAIWHDDTVLDICAKWLAKEKGICWVQHTFFGRELSRRTGIPYYGQSGLDAQGNSLVALAESIKEGKSKPVPVIASIASNGTGKNLQAWHKNLIASCPTGGDQMEQIIGRTHREGQDADEVEVEILLGCVEHVAAWEQVTAEAKMALDMFGAPQRVLFGDVVMPKTSHLRGARWTKTSQKKC